jgi:hypothetical protein
VKIRAGQIFEVKRYHGSPESLTLRAAPAAASSAGRSGRFRSGGSAPDDAGPPAWTVVY